MKILVSVCLVQTHILIKTISFRWFEQYLRVMCRLIGIPISKIEQKEGNIVMVTAGFMKWWDKKPTKGVEE